MSVHVSGGFSMKSPVMFLTVAASAALSIALTFSPVVSFACDDGAGKCACGAACPEKMGDKAAADADCAGEAAQGGEKKAGSCACSGAAAAEAANHEAAPGGAAKAATGEIPPAANRADKAEAGGCNHGAE
jgi:hypothetical protein